MTAMVGSLGADGPRVLDLACGPGSITRRVLDRHPGARVTGLDIDPVLLAIYTACHGDDDHVSWVSADLELAGWSKPLSPEAGGFDAVLVATALHWLLPDALSRVYVEVASLLRPGGLFANADHAPIPGRPALTTVLSAVHEAERVPLDDGRDTWDGWWQRVASDPDLARLYEERSARFPGGHAEEFEPPAEWHLEHLALAGFAEAAVVWRRGGDAITAAIR